MLTLLLTVLLAGPVPAAPPAPFPDFGLTFSYVPARDGLALLRGGPSQDGYAAHRQPGRIWAPRLSWETRPNGGDNVYNGEFQFYVDPERQWPNRFTPFALKNGLLRIRGQRTNGLGFRPGDILNDPATGRPYEWVSGVLTSHPSFSQHGGYFEIDAKMPKGRGTWPAFWLLPVDGQHPPEIDIVEYRGHEPDRYHIAALFGPHNTTDAYLSAGTDLSLAFHRYAVLWTDTALMFFLDRRLVQKIDITDREGFGRAFYLIVNLAVGSRGLEEFIPPPDGTTPNPADLLVRSIQVWQRRGPTAVGLSATSVSDTAAPGTVIADLSSTVFGDTGAIHYTIAADPDGKFAINGTHLVSRAPFDVLHKQAHPLSVLATDAQGRSWRHAFTIDVLDFGRAINLYGPGTGWDQEHVATRSEMTDTDGQQTATFLREEPGGRQFGITRNAPSQGDAPTRYIVSGDFKPFGRNWIKAEISTGDYRKNVQAFFDISTGRLGSVFASPAPASESPFVLNRRPVIAQLANGYYRCMVDLTAVGTDALRTTWRIVDHNDEQAEGHQSDPMFQNGTGQHGRGVIVGRYLTMVAP